MNGSDLLTAFGPEALTAVAIIFVVRMLLAHIKEQNEAWRQSIKDVIEANKETSKAEIKAVVSLSETVEELRDNTADLGLKIELIAGSDDG